MVSMVLQYGPPVWSSSMVSMVLHYGQYGPPVWSSSMVSMVLQPSPYTQDSLDLFVGNHCVTPTEGVTHQSPLAPLQADQRWAGTLAGTLTGKLAVDLGEG